MCIYVGVYTKHLIKCCNIFKYRFSFLMCTVALLNSNWVFLSFQELFYMSQKNNNYFNLIMKSHYTDLPKIVQAT